MGFWIDITKTQAKILFAVDPCKKCIVKACCTEECESSIEFRKTTGGEPFMMKAAAMVIILSLIVAFLQIGLFIRNLIKLF